MAEHLGPTSGESTGPGSPSSADAHQLAAGLRAARRSEAEAAALLARGAVIDRFVILRQLGRGGMGVVYLAHDPELDRKVALKLLSSPTTNDSHAVQTRLLREAQALARLAHPNVVAVHDVGTHAGNVWIAMEFVAGHTLRAWGETPRRWFDVLRVLIEAARGVAAAHAVGLVHRDLKPDNVMIDGEGRVRVMDFGLAHYSALVHDSLADTHDSTDPAETIVALTRRLTATGGLPGTPLYMAPEQWQGRAAEAAADQFSWCVMAWELLYGERPFRGPTLLAQADAVLAGRPAPPPRARKIPGWLRRVVQRGLAVRPADRWPNMAALLAALTGGRTRARLRLAAAALVGLAVLTAVGVAYDRWDRARRISDCTAVAADIASVWNDDARHDVRDALLATRLGHAATTADKVMPWLDRQAEAWRAGREEVCHHAHVERTWGADLQDRAVWCLDERRAEMTALIEAMKRGDAAMVGHATLAATKLRPIATCLDPAFLQRHAIPPMELRAEVQSVSRELSYSTALDLSGEYTQALATASGARERAANSRWPSLWALARFREGQVLELLGKLDEAETAMTEAYFAAAQVESWPTAAIASQELSGVVGYTLARPVDGRMWARHSQIAQSLAGDDGGTRAASLENNLGNIELRAGRLEQARAHLGTAVAEMTRALGPRHPMVGVSLSNLGNVLHVQGDTVAAKQSYARALEILEPSLGGDAPEVLAVISGLAATELILGEYASAIALNQRNLAIRERTLGPDHPDIAQALSSLGVVYAETGRLAEARATHQRALAINRAALGVDHPNLAIDLHNLAMVDLATGALAEAQSEAEQAIAIRIKALGAEHIAVLVTEWTLAEVRRAMGDLAAAEALLLRIVPALERDLGAEHPDVAQVILGLGKLHRARRDFAAARREDLRALTISEKLLGPRHPQVAHCLGELAGLDIADARAADALPLLTRALAIYSEYEGDQTGELDAHLELARALIATGGDRARARREAEAARAGQSAIGSTTRVAELDAWLAAHASP